MGVPAKSDSAEPCGRLVGLADGSLLSAAPKSSDHLNVAPRQILGC